MTRITTIDGDALAGWSAEPDGLGYWYRGLADGTRLDVCRGTWWRAYVRGELVGNSYPTKAAAQRAAYQAAIALAAKEAETGAC